MVEGKMLIGVLILAGLGAILGALDYEVPSTYEPYSISSQHSHREVLRLPGYSGPLPSRHYSGMYLMHEWLNSLENYTS